MAVLHLPPHFSVTEVDIDVTACTVDVADVDLHSVCEKLPSGDYSMSGTQTKTTIYHIRIRLHLMECLVNETHYCVSHLHVHHLLLCCTKLIYLFSMSFFVSLFASES